MSARATKLEQAMSTIKTKDKERCIVGDAMAEKDIGSIVSKYVESDRYSNRSISVGLRAADIRLSATSIGMHRRQECGCFR